MCVHGTETILPTPEWAREGRANPDAGISIDSCIQFALEYAWSKGVRTLGSCCGHFAKKPSVVITEEVGMAALAREILPDWDIYQWNLVNVSHDV